MNNIIKDLQKDQKIQSETKYKDYIIQRRNTGIFRHYVAVHKDTKKPVLYKNSTMRVLNCRRSDLIFNLNNNI